MHLAENGESDEMLKVPKRRMPLLILALKLTKRLQVAITRTKAQSFTKLAAATCMPMADSKTTYLDSILELPPTRELTLTDYFEAMITQESTAEIEGANTLKEYSEEFYQKIKPNTKHIDKFNSVSEALLRVHELLTRNNLTGKRRLAYARPLSPDVVLKIVYAYTV